MLAHRLDSLMTMDQLELFVDPVCPWTWLTSRWLESVEAELGLTVRYSVVSLLELNGDDPSNPWIEAMRQGRRLQRVMVRLLAAGDDARVSALYRAAGRATFEGGRTLDAELVRELGEGLGLSDEDIAAADDGRLDAAVVTEHQRAMRLAGPDVGSPILARRGGERGFYGPIVDRPLAPDEAVRLWHIVEGVLDTPALFEIKRGRAVEPRFA